MDIRGGPEKCRGPSRAEGLTMALIMSGRCAENSGSVRVTFSTYRVGSENYETDRKGLVGKYFK